MNKEFGVHMLNDSGKAGAKAISEAFDLLLTTLVEERESGPDTPKVVPLCPPSRETSLLRTKLEEACFFAKKAMASAPGNSDSP